MFHFYTPWKLFWRFSGDVETGHWREMKEYLNDIKYKKELFTGVLHDSCSEKSAKVFKKLLRLIGPYVTKHEIKLLQPLSPSERV